MNNETKGKGLNSNDDVSLEISLSWTTVQYKMISNTLQLEEIITHHFTKVLKAVSKLRHELIRLLDYEEEPYYLQENVHKFFPWFKVLISYFL